MNDSNREFAREPEGLARLFNARANAGDIEGLVALYRPDAVLAAGAAVATGHAAIRAFYTDLLSHKSSFPPVEALPVLRNGSFALTFARAPNGNISVELAELQPDGAWLWIIDQLKIPPSAAAPGR